MTLTAHIKTLEERKKELELQIHEEAARPMPNFMLINELKKKKLRTKEKIYTLVHPEYSELDAA